MVFRLTWNAEYAVLLRAVDMTTAWHCAFAGMCIDKTFCRFKNKTLSVLCVRQGLDTGEGGGGSLPKVMGEIETYQECRGRGPAPRRMT